MQLRYVSTPYISGTSDWVGQILRKPSFEHISYYFSKDNICFLPRNLNGTAEFRYITQPTEAIRVVNINPDTTIEDIIKNIEAQWSQNGDNSNQNKPFLNAALIYR